MMREFKTSLQFKQWVKLKKKKEVDHFIASFFMNEKCKEACGSLREGRSFVPAGG